MAIKYLNKEGLQHFWSGIKKANVASATKLQTARTINGTSFNGTANITTANWGTARNIGIVSSDGTSTAVPVSVNGSGNINLKLPSTIKASLTGNSSSATKLQAARKINGVAFDGTKDISIPIPEVPIGSIISYASTQIPDGWLLCNGQTVSEKDYPKLYQLIGNTYGGVTGLDFQVPNLSGRVIVGKEPSGIESNLGVIGGEKEHRLTLEEMPEHRHEFGISFEGVQPRTREWSIRQYKEYMGNYMLTEPVGRDKAHNNMQPYMILNYIIKAK